MKLKAKQVVASAEEHRKFITESHITHGEMLGITKLDTKYRKRDKTLRYVDNVKKKPTEARLAALRTQDEVPTASENV